MVRKHTYKYIKSVIEDKNGTLLSIEYGGNKLPMDVRCNECGNIFHPSFNNIRKGSWCVTCSGFKNKKYTIDEVRDEITKRGGELLSKEYIGCTTNIKIKCLTCDNIWSPKFRDVMSGRWCSCRKISKNHEALYNILRTLFPEPKYTIHINYNRFDWLRNNKTGKKQEIDIFVSGCEFSLAVEYDGQQHFYPVSFGGISEARARKKFIKQKQMDKRKNNLIKKYPDDIMYFVRFDYKENITKEYVIEKLAKSALNKGKQYGRTKGNQERWKRSNLREQF